MTALVIAVVIGKKRHVIRQPVRVVAFNVREVEQNFIVVSCVRADLLIPLIYPTSCAGTVQMPCHVYKLHSRKILFQLVHKSQVRVDLCLCSVHLAAP